MQVVTISCLVLVELLTSQINEITASNFTKFDNGQTVQVSLGDTQFASGYEGLRLLQPNIVYYLNIDNIPDWVEFVVVQVHAYLHNVTLKYTIDKVPGKFVSGQNVGLVKAVADRGIAQLFLENENPYNTTVLLAVVPYEKSAPVPGGCNMEFSVETSPWLQVDVPGPYVTVSSQPAKDPSGPCGSLAYLQYQGYHLYLPEHNFAEETYFEFISKMLTVERIEQNGRKVEMTTESVMKHMFSAYHGTGAVYAVVVSAGDSAAAYVPAFTYSCSPAHYTDSCQVLTSTFTRSLCALVLFIGLFVCLYGHSFFQTELLLFGTLVGGVVAYVLIAPYGFTDSTNVLLSTAAGVSAGNVWLLLWWICGSPLVSIFVVTVALGSLIASLAFYTLLGDNPFMRYDVNYWLMFVCLVLAVALLAATRYNRVNILSCSVVGSYAVVLPIDLYVGANLKYIFINTVRRATVPGFGQAVIDPPVQTEDYILATLWTLLALVGYAMQSLRFGDRPAFPSRPSLGCGSVASSPRSPHQAERRPLLNVQPFTFFGSTDSVFT